MGKGQRVREGRAAEKEAMKVMLAKKAKKKKTTTIVTSIIAAVLVLCLAAGFIYQTVYQSAYSRGDIQRGTVVMQTENYTVDATMMSYYFFTQYNTFVNNYSSYVTSIGLDPNVSLRRQDSTFQSGSTWFEYFCDQTSAQVKEMLYLAEKALAAGMKLEEADQKTIQTALDSYKEFAKENSYKEDKIFSMVFGTGVQESDVRKCLELSALADKFYKDYNGKLVYTDAEIEQYYKDNIKTYLYVDYYTYDVEAKDTKDSATYADAKARADALAAVKSGEDFAKWVEADIRANTPITKDYTKEDLEDHIEETLAGLKLNKVTRVTDNAASTWMFDTAKVGETYIEDDESGTYTVYYLTATPYRDESATKNIRQLVFTKASYDKDLAKAKAAAEDVMKKLKDEGLTDDAFLTYAAEYSEDGNTAGTGGLCENFAANDFDTAVSAWAFKEGRAAGDFELVEITDGYAICYFIGEGETAWKADCISAKKTADYTAAYEEWAKAITLTENKNGYDKIPDNV